MIKTIHSYILRDMLKTFFFALFVCSIVLTIVFLVSIRMKPEGQGLGLNHLLLMAPYMFVEVSRISIPMTLLVATTTFFARMAGSNEVIALKSLGIPPWRILWPVMVIGLLVSLFSVWLNDWGVTWSRANMTRVIYNAAEDIILNELRTNHFYAFDDGGGVTIMAQGVDGKRLLGATFTVKEPPMTINAQEAGLEIDLARQELILTFYQIHADVGGDIKYDANFDRYVIPLEQFVKKDNGEDRPSEMGMKDIPNDMEKQREIIASNRRVLASELAFSILLGDYTKLSHHERFQTVAAIEGAEKRLDRLQTEPPRRWASAFCCFFFIWVGAPLAIWMKKSDIFSSFFACFIPILLVYYPVMMIGLQGAKSGFFPASFVWIGNICLAFVGSCFIQRIHRY